MSFFDPIHHEEGSPQRTCQNEGSNVASISVVKSPTEGFIKLSVAAIQRRSAGPCFFKISIHETGEARSEIVISPSFNELEYLHVDLRGDFRHILTRVSINASTELRRITQDQRCNHHGILRHKKMVSSRFGGDRKAGMQKACT